MSRKPNRIYSSGERFGRNNQQTEINIFKKDMEYVDSEGKYSQPEGPNPDDSLVRSRYERLDPQVFLKRSHVKEIFDDRERYYKDRYVYNPDDWVLETCNAQYLNADLMSRWGLGGSRPENRRLIKNTESAGKVDIKTNIYNRRPNHENIQTYGHYWLYDYDQTPNEFDREDNNYSLVRKTLNDKKWKGY